ncbi:MAG: tail fiber protein [Kiritimatiellae bacterium]|nr:tail fiber protein [Kiritimatiellia bacterium]
MKSLVRFFGLAAVVCAAATWCAAPATGSGVAGGMNYKGHLARSDGQALDEIQHLVFRIYDAEEGGTLIWAREIPVTVDRNGNFDVMLDDSGNPAGTAVKEHLEDAFEGGTRYLELEVEGAGVIRPRQPVSTGGQALHARYALWSDGNFAAGETVRTAGAAVFGGGLTVDNDLTVGKDFVSVTGLTVTNDLTVKGTLKVADGGAMTGHGTMPVGAIVMWSGETDTVPKGWAVCDGSTQEGMQTPDLRGWFVMHPREGKDAGEESGGAESVTLNQDQIPPHTHGIWKRNSRSEGRCLLESDGSFWSDSANSVDTSSAGGGGAHENRPQYMALYYIMRVK